MERQASRLSIPVMLDNLKDNTFLLQLFKPSSNHNKHSFWKFSASWPFLSKALLWIANHGHEDGIPMSLQECSVRSYYSELTKYKTKAMYRKTITAMVTNTAQCCGRSCMYTTTKNRLMPITDTARTPVRIFIILKYKITPRCDKHRPVLW